MGPGPSGCRQTTTMAEEIVSCCTSTLSTGLRHPRFPDRAHQVPPAWGHRLASAIPVTALNSSNRPICVRSRVPRASRTNRPKVTSMSGPEWSIGTRKPQKSPRSTSPSAERVVRRVASASGIIRPRAVSMWGSEWQVSGTRRPRTSLALITRSAERVVRQVASVSDTIRPKVSIRPMSVCGWPSGTRSRPTNHRSISPSAPLTADSRVASVSGIIRLRHSVSPRCRDTTAVRIPAPIVSHDLTISARCTASSGPRTIVTQSAIRSCVSTRRVRAAPASTRTRTRSRVPSPRRRSRHRRRRRRRTTASSHHRHCHPVRARSMPRARVWLITLLLIAFCPPILRGPSIAPTAPLQHRRCPPRSASPPPNGCWLISSQPRATLRISNVTLDHRTACYQGPPRFWEDYKRDSRIVEYTPRILATPPFPRTRYYPPRRYTLRYRRDSSASRKDTWANRPFTIDILDRTHQRQHIMSDIRRWRRPPRGQSKSDAILSLRLDFCDTIVHSGIYWRFWQKWNIFSQVKLFIRTNKILTNICATFRSLIDSQIIHLKLQQNTTNCTMQLFLLSAIWKLFIILFLLTEYLHPKVSLSLFLFVID